MRKLTLIFLIVFLSIGCKAKTSPYQEEARFLKNYYKKGKISKAQYQKLHSRAKQKTTPR